MSLSEWDWFTVCGINYTLSLTKLYISDLLEMWREMTSLVRSHCIGGAGSPGLPDVTRMLSVEDAEKFKQALSEELHRFSASLKEFMAQAIARASITSGPDGTDVYRTLGEIKEAIHIWKVSGQWLF